LFSEIENRTGHLVGQMRRKVGSLRWERNLGSCLLDDFHNAQQEAFLDLQEVVPVTGEQVGENLDI
jgi:hypothetical protein